MTERPTRADAVRNREKILEAARARFAAVGPEVGMEDIARHAAVAVGTLYRHFQDKDDLAAAVLEEFLTAVADDAEAAADRVSDGADAGQELAGFLERALAAVTRNRAAKFATGGAAERGSERARQQQRASDAIGGLLRAGQAAGRIAPGISAADLDMLLTGVPADLSTDARARWLNLVLYGLLRPGSAVRPRND